MATQTQLYEHADTAVINAIARVTGGNFRLARRLFAQIERIVTINKLPTITTEVVTLARGTGRRPALACLPASIFTQPYDNRRSILQTPHAQPGKTPGPPKA